MLCGCCMMDRDTVTAQNANAHKATRARALVGPQQEWQSAASVYICSRYHPASLVRFQMAARNGNNCSVMCECAEQPRCLIWSVQTAPAVFFFRYYCGSVCLCTCLRTPGSCSAWIILSVLHQIPADVLVHINSVMKRHSDWGVLNNSPTKKEKSVTSVHDNRLQPTGPWQTEANTGLSSLNAKWEVAGTHYVELSCALFSTRNSLQTVTNHSQHGPEGYKSDALWFAKISRGIKCECL